MHFINGSALMSPALWEGGAPKGTKERGGQVFKVSRTAMSLKITVLTSSSELVSP